MTRAEAPLRPGDPAPDFTLRDQHGGALRLSSMRGERDVLLVFYPFAFTGVCSQELQVLRDRWRELAAPDRALLAVSCDPVYALRAYADREGLGDLTLLSDFWPHGAVAASYGVLDRTIGAPHRSSFVIGRDGQVRWTLHVQRHESRTFEAYRAGLDEARKANSP